MEYFSLTAVADEQLARARLSHNGRAARTIFKGDEHSVRQTVIAIVGGYELSEHYSPNEATLQVLDGEVRFTAGGESWDGAIGDFVIIPAVKHSLAALADSVVLLTADIETSRGD
jgi:quercetin dioxygenase-like cupin family protein